MRLQDCLKIVEGGGPVLLNTAGIAGDYVSLKNARAVDILVALAPASGTDTAAITVKQATDVGNSASDEKAVAFTVAQKMLPSSAVDSWAEVAVTANSITTSAGAAKEYWLIHIDASMLDVAGGFDCVRVDVTDPGSVSTPAIALYFLHPVYAPNFPSAIVD